MEKVRNFLIYSGVLLCCLVFSIKAHAATVGDLGDINAFHGRGVFSLKETRNISVESSIDVDVVLDRKLSAGDVTDAKFETNEWSMVRLGYRMFDRVEPYVRLGWAHLKAGWTDNSSGTKVELSTKSGFGWGFGIKALIYEFKNPKIEIIGDGSYRTADLDTEKGYFDGNKTAINITSSKFVIREWQAALLTATEIDLGAMLSQVDALKECKLSPYGGITYSEISGRLRLVATDGTVYHPDNIKSDKNVGIVVGCDLLLPEDYASFNLEGRFINETAVSAGLAMLF